MDTRQSILQRINAFLDRHSIGRTEFGRLAVGDRDFVRDLENGAPVTLGRIEKAEAFMRAREQTATEVGVAEVGEEGGEVGGGVDHAKDVSGARRTVSAKLAGVSA